MTITRRTFSFAVASSALLSTAVSRRARAQDDVFKMMLGTPFLPSHPGASRMIEACEAIRAETNGAVQIQVFPGNVLGGESEMQSQLRQGAIDFMTTSGVVMQTLVPVAGINAVPYAFKDYSDVWAAMDGDLGAHVRSAVQQRGHQVRADKPRAAGDQDAPEFGCQ